jgi:predicted transcriptional regulator
MCANFKYDKENITLRRGRVLELAARGKSQIQIAQELGVSNSLISLDLQFIRTQAQEHLQTHIQDTVVLQWEKTMSGLQQVLQKVWDIAEHSEKTSEKLEAYGLINNCYKYINDMSTDSTIISKALKFVLDIQKGKEEQVQEIEQEPEQIQQQDELIPVQEQDPIQEQEIEE